jgi:molybdopterin converting factor small subunit
VNITVRCYGPPKTVLGLSEDEMWVPDGTRLGDLCTLLEEEYGEEARRVLRGAEPFDGLVVLINGRHHFTLEGNKTVLAEGDRIVVMPPISGG